MPLPQEERSTLADLLTWPESPRIELIEGRPVMMAPPKRVHQEVSGALFAQLYNYLSGKRCRVYAAPFAVRLFERAEEAPENVDTVVEPDLSVVCDPDKLDELGCRGAPDLVVEILSPTTARQDRFVKFRLYQRASVREYWIIDPDNQTVQVYQLEEGSYGAAEVYIGAVAVPVGVLDHCTVDMAQVFPKE